MYKRAIEAIVLHKLNNYSKSHTKVSFNDICIGMEVRFDIIIEYLEKFCSNKQISIKIDYLNEFIEFDYEDINIDYKNKILKESCQNVINIQKELINVDFKNQVGVKEK